MDVEGLHLCVRHVAALALELLIGLQVGAEPEQLDGAVWVVTIVHLVQTCTHPENRRIRRSPSISCLRPLGWCGLTSKLIEMISNVEGLVIVAGVLVVNKLDASWKEKQLCLDDRRHTRVHSICLFPFYNSDPSFALIKLTSRLC